MRKIKIFLSTKHLQNLIYTLLSSGTLILTACDADTTWGHINQTDDASQSNQYCQAFKEPFWYDICAIDEKMLLAPSHHQNHGQHGQKDTKQQAEQQAQNLSLRLFWRQADDNTDKNAKPLFTFSALKQQLSANKQLLFASNAGMYNHEFAPIGYTVIDGKQILSLNLNEGEGNFHLMPNGVFWWNDDGFHIDTSEQMQRQLKAGVKPKFATQSGPMLVIDGAMHPKFTADSTSKKIRNGIGISEDGKIKLVHSRVPVNFYEFALLFRTQLNCKNALFLDGGIASALYAPELKINDKKNMGVMIGLIESKFD